MSLPNRREIYRSEIKRLIREKKVCPFDGFSCCSICESCGEPFCECSKEGCERMNGHGCPATRGEG